MENIINSKLDRVLNFYLQQLETIKAQSWKHQAKVNEINLDIEQLRREMNAVPTYFEDTDPITARRLVNDLMRSAQSRIEEKQVQLHEAEAQLQASRNLLLKQKSKIDSIEKLIERKSKAVEYIKQRANQTTLDERYLGQFLRGPVK